MRRLVPISMSVALAVTASGPSAAYPASAVVAQVPSQRDTLVSWLTTNESLALPYTTARALSDSIPSAIVSEILQYSRARTAHSHVRCAHIPDFNRQQSAPDIAVSTICVVSGDATSYAAVIRASTERASVIWDTTLSSSYPQPGFGFYRGLGGQGDTAVTIVLSGIGPNFTFALIRWNGATGRVVGEFSGGALDTIDVDLDGIPELSIPELDRTPPDFEAIRTERYYKLDRSTGVYKAMPVPADSAGKK